MELLTELIMELLTELLMELLTELLMELHSGQYFTTRRFMSS